MIRFLDCKIQSYAWGKLGKDSLVAQMKNSSCNGKFEIVEDAPYAEYWIGTHKNGPSMIQEDKDNVLLSSFLGRKMSYLLKILSVRKALSIQSHPDKKLAEKLHGKFPSVYKDPNHKPEVCVALTDFYGMFGFRDKNEIIDFFETRPTLKSLVSTEILETLKDHSCCKNISCHCMGDVFTDYIHNGLGEIAINNHVTALEKILAEGGALMEADLLSMELAKEYPSDLGVFAPYFFNVMSLKPGEAMFIPPSTPHAYLSGDCVEIMACSDNVIRAGLTPKFIDKDTLCSMLEYKCEKRVPMIEKRTGPWIEYDAPCEEFTLKRLVLKPLEPTSDDSIAIEHHEVTTTTATSDSSNEEINKEDMEGDSNLKSFVHVEAENNDRILLFVSGDVELISETRSGDVSQVGVPFGSAVFVPAYTKMILKNNNTSKSSVIFSAQEGKVYK
eukprot:TRINITY_DN78868_c0_g1_i1.p1 TRINITY_DN78868_c0_g1~~TRINITY_DN78868_c0_g1_i1.p1  ORF type:complete len:443 (+),score=88.66 TRINITY_DN78868_c0_g1_i1:62-1390(+)